MTFPLKGYIFVFLYWLRVMKITTNHGLSLGRPLGTWQAIQGFSLVTWKAIQGDDPNPLAILLAVSRISNTKAHIGQAAQHLKQGKRKLAKMGKNNYLLKT